MEIEDENVKIKIVFPKKQMRLLANANISLNTIEYGFITIKGFQIWPSSQMNTRLQEEINITPPSRMLFGRYYPFVWIEDEKQWHELEGRIYDAYHKAKNKQVDSEKVNPEDIPF